MTITRVQSASVGINAAPFTITAPSNFTPGNLIVVSHVVWYSAPTGLTIGGLAATKVVTADGGGSDLAIQWYVVATGAITGASVTSTATGGDYYEGSVVEYASTTGWPADPVTASGATPTTATGTSAAPTASLTTTAADCVIVSNWSNSSNGSGDDGTPPATGYTRDFTAVADEGGAGGSKIVTSTGSQSATHSVAGSVAWGCTIVAYAANTGGGGATVDADAGTDAPALTDSISQTSTFGRLGSDTVAATDDLVVQASRLISVSDAIVITEAITAVLYRVISIAISTDTAVFDDSIFCDLYQPADALVITDTVTVAKPVLVSVVIPTYSVISFAN